MGVGDLTGEGGWKGGIKFFYAKPLRLYHGKAATPVDRCPMQRKAACPRRDSNSGQPILIEAGADLFLHENSFSWQAKITHKIAPKSHICLALLWWKKSSISPNLRGHNCELLSLLLCLKINQTRDEFKPSFLSDARAGQFQAHLVTVTWTGTISRFLPLSRRGWRSYFAEHYVRCTRDTIMTSLPCPATWSASCRCVTPSSS